MTATAPVSPWRAALTFAATSGLIAISFAPLLRGPLWKRALSSQIVLDESTALPSRSPRPSSGG
jgi:hypothetical protein